MKVANDQNELRKEWEWRGQKTRGGGGGGTRHREKNKAGGEQRRRQLPRAAGVSLQPGPHAAKAAQQGHRKQVLVPAPPQGCPTPGSRLARERAAAGATAAATGNSKRTTMVQVKRTGKNRVKQLPLPPADVVGMTPPRRWAAQRAASSVLQRQDRDAETTLSHPRRCRPCCESESICNWQATGTHQLTISRSLLNHNHSKS